MPPPPPPGSPAVISLLADSPLAAPPQPRAPPVPAAGGKHKLLASTIAQQARAAHKQSGQQEVIEPVKGFATSAGSQRQEPQVVTMSDLIARHASQRALQSAAQLPLPKQAQLAPAAAPRAATTAQLHSQDSTVKPPGTTTATGARPTSAAAQMAADRKPQHKAHALAQAAAEDGELLLSPASAALARLSISPGLKAVQRRVSAPRPALLPLASYLGSGSSGGPSSMSCTPEAAARLGSSGHGAQAQGAPTVRSSSSGGSSSGGSSSSGGHHNQGGMQPPARAPAQQYGGGGGCYPVRFVAPIPWLQPAVSSPPAFLQNMQHFLPPAGGWGAPLRMPVPPPLPPPRPPPQPLDAWLQPGYPFANAHAPAAVQGRLMQQQRSRSASPACSSHSSPGADPSQLPRSGPHHHGVHQSKKSPPKHQQQLHAPATAGVQLTKGQRARRAKQLRKAAAAVAMAMAPSGQAAAAAGQQPQHKQQRASAGLGTMTLPRSPPACVQTATASAKAAVEQIAAGIQRLGISKGGGASCNTKPQPIKPVDSLRPRDASPPTSVQLPQVAQKQGVEWDNLHGHCVHHLLYARLTHSSTVCIDAPKLLTHHTVTYCRRQFLPDAERVQADGGGGAAGALQGQPAVGRRQVRRRLGYEEVCT